MKPPCVDHQRTFDLTITEGPAQRATRAALDVCATRPRRDACLADELAAMRQGVRSLGVLLESKKR